MPVPDPKSLQPVFDRLLYFYSVGKSPGDIESHTLLKKLENARTLFPSNAYKGLGMLAALNDDIELTNYNYRKAAEYAPTEPTIYYNYALSLMRLGYPDEAVAELKKVLKCGISAKPLLNDLAANALALGDEELILDTLSLANKLQYNAPNIFLLACYVGVANADSPDEEAQILDMTFSEKFLRNNSVKISEDAWKEMQNLADELGKYI